MTMMRPPARSTRWPRAAAEHSPNRRAPGATRRPRGRRPRRSASANGSVLSGHDVHVDGSAAPSRRRARAAPPCSLATANRGVAAQCPTFAAIAPASDGSSMPICSTRSPMRTPLIVTGNGSRVDAAYAKTCAFPHDIVADCDSTTRNCPCARQAWRAARRPRRRQHDDDRRRDARFARVWRCRSAR